jgi:hypothetical protein
MVTARERGEPPVFSISRCHPATSAHPFPFCRTFIKEELTPFAAANPWLSIEVVSKQGKAPTLIAEYREFWASSFRRPNGVSRKKRPTAVDGTGKHVDVKNKPAKHILEVARELRDGTTATVRKLMKPVVTARPSVQGVWGPDVSHAAAFALREST